MKFVGEKLKELRADCHMTQDDIAELLNMSRTSFSKYENGAANPPLNVLRKLSAIYNVPIEYLIHDEITSIRLNNGKNETEPDVEEALKGFSDLTREEKMLVMKLRLKGSDAIKEIEKLLEEE
ncbi:MAG: helix-turn-helix domain-containing protein [Clostridia bacterium]|nr:helix-turn-helix domain-containing protein [Clostridia bacterium]